MTRRLQAHHVASTEWTRRDWRELLITTARASDWISGVILHDETAGQLTGTGERFPAAIAARGMIPGIKVDAGTVALGDGDEMVTEGLDGLGRRLDRYRATGLRFAKWRAIFTIDQQRELPSGACVEENAARLARYAGLCQREGIVPIVEPEVLMEGTHTLEVCAHCTRRVLAAVFAHLADGDVDLAGVVLKPNMVLPGDRCPVRGDDAAIAAATLDCLRATVPSELAGVAFLSGGQTSEDATSRLAAINTQGRQPWPLTFSYGRALQQDALARWAGDPTHAADAQRVFAERARANSAARCSPATAVR